MPQDMAIVGFGDIGLASLVPPPLPTMHVPRLRMGEEAIGMLLDKFENPDADAHREIHARLVVRSSCDVDLPTDREKTI